MDTITTTANNIEINRPLLYWVLRLAVFGEFFGHGVLAVQGKAAWVGWIEQLTGVNTATAGILLVLIGALDIVVAVFVLLRPVRLVLLWAACWGFWTALLRPVVGESIWDFVERWTNWGAPLALLLIKGWPRSGQEWLN